jgi:hypothetical protein
MPARQLAENAVCPCEFMPRCPRPVAEWSGDSTKIPSSAAPSKPPPKPITYNSRCDPTASCLATASPLPRPYCLALGPVKGYSSWRGHPALASRGRPALGGMARRKDGRGGKRPPSRRPRRFEQGVSIFEFPVFGLHGRLESGTWNLKPPRLGRSSFHFSLIPCHLSADRRIQDGSLDSGMPQYYARG